MPVNVNLRCVCGGGGGGGNASMFVLAPYTFSTRISQTVSALGTDMLVYILINFQTNDCFIGGL